MTGRTLYQRIVDAHTVRPLGTCHSQVPAWVPSMMS